MLSVRTPTSFEKQDSVEKLEISVERGVALELIESYVTDGIQYVSHSGMNFGTIKINFAVGQGTELKWSSSIVASLYTDLILLCITLRLTYVRKNNNYWGDDDLSDNSIN